MITWDDSFVTGVAEIDEQHRALIEKYNDFHNAIVQGAGRASAGEMLDFLRSYAAWHFEKEESCMEEYRCPVAAANKEAHAAFVARFNQFYAQWQTAEMDYDLMLDTYLALGDWIVNHIQRVDAQLGPCVRGDLD